MIRLTTPTHRFKFPFELDENVAKVLITYAQNRKIVLEKEFEGAVSGNTIEYRLTQEETKRFSPFAKAEIQIRVLFADGKAVASHIYDMKVDDVLNGEVMEANDDN